MTGKKLITFLACFLSVVLLHAQEKKNTAEMADVMRSNGMIYVVVAVMITILLGLILYLVRIERKVKKIEKENFRQN